MTEWEYTWFQVSWVKTGERKEKGRTLEEGRWEGRDEVQKAGQEGWELVSVQPFISTHGGESWAGGPGASSVSSYMFFFKRPKRSSDADTSP